VACTVKKEWGLDGKEWASKEKVELDWEDWAGKGESIGLGWETVPCTEKEEWGV
jgi:hypothetical protein